MRHYVGSPVLVDYFVVDRSMDPPAPADATAAVSITAPDGAEQLASAGHPELGHYTFSWIATQPGVYSGDLSASGTVTDVTPFAVQVWPAVSRLWLPTPDQVHALIPMRPGFTTTSVPSIDQVDELIDLAADSLASEAPAEFPLAMTGKVRFAVALNAASLVESSFFPEQDIGPDDPARLLYDRYVGELTGLRGLLGQVGGVTRQVGSIRVGGAPRRHLPCW